MQNRLARAAPRLPSAVTQQGVRVDKSRSNFLLFTILSSDDPAYDPVALGDYASRNVLPEIQRLPGVGQAQLFGTERAMRIWIDPAKLVGYNLSAERRHRRDPRAERAGVVGRDRRPAQRGRPGHRRHRGGQRPARQRREFGNIVLRANADGSTVRLQDVARIELGAQNYATSARLNGKPSTGIGVQLSPTGNALATATAVRKRMDELAALLPAGHEVRHSLRQLALRQDLHPQGGRDAGRGDGAGVPGDVPVPAEPARYTIIPTIVVPVALLGTFAVLLALGFSINVLTMFGMVLAIGIVVDDAIVVVENVERIMSEEGLPPREATRKAMGQISGAIIGITRGADRGVRAAWRSSAARSATSTASSPS